MFIVRVTDRVPSRSVFKPDTFRVRYLKVCCKRSYQLLEQPAGATEFNSNLEASCVISALCLNVSRCEVGLSPNPPKKKTGFFS